LIAAAEGLEYRKPLKPGRGVYHAYDAVRQRVERLTADRSMTADIEGLAAAIGAADFDSLG
jgi:histidine ammonia-lyase